MVWSKMLSLSGAAVITFGGVFLLAPPAFGKAPNLFVTAPANVVVSRISYADLNLASSAGERTLNRRVSGAVRDLCLEATGGNDGSVGFKYAMKACGNQAWDEARPQIGRAVQRAHDIASTGTSTISAAAITIAIPE